MIITLILKKKYEKTKSQSFIVCLFCDNRDFTEKKIPFPTEKGMVFSEAFVCTRCNEPLMSSKQMDNFIKLSKEDE